MRVIKRGRKQNGWSKKCVCTGLGNGGGGCGATLLVSASDLYQTASHHCDGSSDYYTTFCCSECGVETDISERPPFWGGRQPSQLQLAARAHKRSRDV